MAVTHGIALLFAIAFAVIGMIFKRVFWWLLSIAYLACLSYMAVINSWEILFFAPLIFLAIISTIGMILSATRGDLI